jgi:threonylcarbamoyladenosine tRNA methylthiotransferase MtaB
MHIGPSFDGIAGKIDPLRSDLSGRVCDPSVAAFTLGCRLNQADTALLFDRFERAGYRIVDLEGGETPSVILINTCTVTATAGQKCRQTLRRLRRNHPSSLIVVTGCGVEIDADAWRSETAVDLVVPNACRTRIVELVEKRLDGTSPGKADVSEPVPSRRAVFREEAVSRSPFRTRVFLKIQEGCNGTCSYCIVPKARGPERSRDHLEVIEEAHHHVAAGIREIVLTGVNICAYRDGSLDLPALVRAIASIPGEYRIRLSSTEPSTSVAETLIPLFAETARLCRFLHLPLQHADDRILAAMNRSTRFSDFARFAETAFRTIPGLHLGTDLIVGYPGETDEIFLENCRRIETIPFANLHVFPFSSRPGTPAATSPGRAPSDVVAERCRILKEIGRRLARKFAESQIGKPLQILVETEDSPGIYEGWSDNYLRVRIASPELKPGALVQTKIGEISEKNGKIKAIGI